MSSGSISQPPEASSLMSSRSVSVARSTRSIKSPSTGCSRFRTVSMSDSMVCVSAAVRS
jgi:hypothetical protein